MALTNGHARSSSLGMPSDAAVNSATSASSPSSCSAMDAEDSKFLGMECSSEGVASPGGVASSGGVSSSKGVTPDLGQPSPVIYNESPSSVPVSEILEQDNVVETVQQKETKLVELPESVGNGIGKDERNEYEIIGQNEVQVHENQMSVQNEKQIENENQNGNQIEVQNGNEDGIQNENQDESQNEILNEIMKAEMKGVESVGVADQEIQSYDKTPENQQSESNLQEVEPRISNHTTTLPNDAEDDIIEVSNPTANGEGVVKSDSIGGASPLVGGASAAEEEEILTKKETSGPTSHGSRGGSFSKWALADSINQAAQARSSRESSIDRELEIHQEIIQYTRP